MQRFDVFMVEKWPLIQAFALEGIGRGSLFTLKYKVGTVAPLGPQGAAGARRGWGAAGAAGAPPSVAITNLCCTFQLVDMSEELWQVYNRLDPVSLNASLTQVTSWDL